MSKVRQQSQAAFIMAEHMPMVSALMAGTHAMRKAGEQFLPKWPNEEKQSYEARLKVATLYPAYSHTVEVMAGKPFSKALTLGEDVPEDIAEMCDDVDMQGRNLHSFASDLMRDCVGFGIGGVLVDYPKTDSVPKSNDGTITRETAKSLNIRPYLTRYEPGSVLGWKTQQQGGAHVLIQVRLLETVTVDDGEFGQKDVEQVRVLTPGAWATYRKGDKEEWVLFENGTTTLGKVPFVFFYGIRKGYGIGLPPLLDLAFQSVEHWQSSSDQQTILHVARVPILTVIGADPKTSITVGASSAVALPQGAELRFVEHSGAAIEAGRLSIKDLEERMRQTGAELIVLRPGQITAAQNNNENEGNKCTLQRIVENFEDSIDECLQLMADWISLPEGGHVSLFKDFGVGTLAEASAQLLLQSNQAGKLSDETFFAEMKRRGIVSADVEWEDEKERIDGQGPSLGGAE